MGRGARHRHGLRTTLAGGHVGRLGVRADGDLQRQYIRDLDASVRQTIASLDPTRTSRSTAPRATRGIFKAYLDAAALLPCCPAALQAASPVVDKYVGTLGGADVFTVDNAFALLESRRVDTGALGPFGIRP